MSFVSQYLTEVKPTIDRAVDNTLFDLAAGLKDRIKRNAQDKVYSYGATASAMAKRRYTIGAAGNISVHTGEYEVTLINESTMQGGDGHETEMVEEGWSNFRQPGPRPFMDEAMNDYIDSGEAETTLANGLRRYGFTVT